LFLAAHAPAAMGAAAAAMERTLSVAEALF